MTPCQKQNKIEKQNYNINTKLKPLRQLTEG
jgi:hypothetical protein